MPSKKNKHVKYRKPQEVEQTGPGSIPITEVDADAPAARPVTAEERATICAQAIVDAQIQTGAVTQDGMMKMFLRQLLEHEDGAYDRTIRLALHMSRQDGIDEITSKDILLALAAELQSIKQPPPPTQPGVHIP